MSNDPYITDVACSMNISDHHYKRNLQIHNNFFLCHLFTTSFYNSGNEEQSALCPKLCDSSPRTMEHNFFYNVSVSALSFFHSAVGNKKESEIQECSKLRKERNMQNHVLEITPLIHLSIMSSHFNIK